MNHICQLCAMKYERQGDLVAHLLQTHGTDWQASQPMLRHLIQVVQAASGCQCNPQPQDASNVHVCVGLRQIAMLFQHCTTDLLVITQFDAPSVALRFAHLENEPSLPALTRALVDRMFSHLWTSPALLQLLRNRCMLCGGYYQPAVTMLHTMRTQECGWAAQILFQIVPALKHLQSTDFQCHSCSLVYNLPPDTPDQHMSQPRRDLQSGHFDSNCPVALQIALLPLFTHGRDAGQPRSRADEQPVGSGTFAPASATSPGQDVKSEESSQSTPVAPTSMLKVLAQIALTHEKSLQLLHRHDCYVLYAQSDPQGAIPLLASLAKTWRDQYQQQMDRPNWLTMRTFLMAGLMKELHL